MRTLNKFVAEAGICSRRKAAELIKLGRIKVNGRTEKNPAYRVLATDKVQYQGRTLRLEAKLYFLLNKPKGVVTTSSDDLGRRTVLDLIPQARKLRLYSVGRLDKDTSGLLIITNDGALAKKLSHPSSEVSKTYVVALKKDLLPTDLVKIQKGIRLEDGRVKVEKAAYVARTKNQVIIQLHSGKNRVIRRLFERLGYDIISLDRIKFAGLSKRGLNKGEFRKLKKEEILKLKNF